MDNIKNVLTREESAVFALRALYSDYGYTRYKMSKFEEYDLYVRNKDFLVSDGIITFTDTDGRLLALKPDVTLSIIRNSRDNSDGLIKVQYNENVYRVSGGTHNFKEFMQVGLECLGAVGDKEITEVLLLAAKSLDLISPDNILEISHLDIVRGVLRAFDVKEDAQKRITAYLGQKNVNGIAEVCTAEGISECGLALIKKLATVYGAPSDVLPALEEFRINTEIGKAIDQLAGITAALSSFGIDKKLCIDFSLVGNMKYYNGIAIRGFVDGLPSGIISGGQYDNLMRKMGRSSRAIGFAVYLDELEKFNMTESFS